MNDETSAIWPPPPENNGPPIEDPELLKAKMAALLGPVRLCFWLSFLLCGIFQLLTLYLGFRANQRAGKGIATGFMIAASIHFIVLVAYSFYGNVIFKWLGLGLWNS